MTDRYAEFYTEGYASVGDLLKGLRDGSLLVHMRVADGKDFRHGIYPSAGSFLRSTEAWQWAEEEYGRGPELTFFSDDLSWADNRNEVLRNSSGKSGALEAVFVERNDDIVKYIEENRVQLGASGSVVPYYRCSMYDYDDPVMKDIPAGVERGDWFTSHQQDVVAVVPAEMLTEAYAIQQVVKALLSAAAELDAKKQALSNYIDAFLEATQPHPFDRSSIYNGHTIVDLRPFDGKIHLSWIQTLKPKSGAATETMKFLTDLADKYGVAMSLSAVPKGKGETKIPKAKLVEFYKRFGFTGHPDDMVREPKVRIRLRGFPKREH
jgi:hypothetical protein